MSVFTYLWLALVATLTATTARAVVLNRFSFANETSAAADAAIVGDAAVDVDDASTVTTRSCRERYSRSPYQIIQDYCDLGKIRIYDLPEDQDDYTTPVMVMPNPPVDTMSMTTGKKGIGGKRGTIEAQVDPEPSGTCRRCHTRVVLEPIQDDDDDDDDASSCGWLAEPATKYPLHQAATCGARLYDACDVDRVLGVHTYSMTQTFFGNQGGYHETIQGMYSVLDEDTGGWVQLPYSSSLLVGSDLQTPVVYHIVGGTGPGYRGIGSPLNEVRIEDGWYFAMLLHYCEEGPSSAGASCADVWDVKEMEQLHLPVCRVYQ
jgi:hypothetical protein